MNATTGSALQNIRYIMGRELRAYFATPLAYVFLVIFLVLVGVFTFYVGNFYERGQADLQSFFGFHPWLYLFLVPAIAMRSWAEERKSGTIELLLTLPIRMGHAVLAKFLAAWLFVALALALTFPMWITVNYLGNPDNGAILAGYLGSWFMAGGYLAIGICISAATRSQVIAFIISFVVCMLFTLSGFPLIIELVRGWLPAVLVEGVSSLSFLTHFQAISRGVLDLGDVFYFLIQISFWLYASAVVIEMTKAD